MISSYAMLGCFALVAVLLSVFPLLLAQAWFRFFSPQRSSLVTHEQYECGLKAKEDVWIQFNVQYYIYALVFLVVDVEAVFLIPLAVAFTELSVGQVLGCAVFVLLLAEGIAWAWLNGYLQWSGVKKV